MACSDIESCYLNYDNNNDIINVKRYLMSIRHNEIFQLTFKFEPFGDVHNTFFYNIDYLIA